MGEKYSFLISTGMSEQRFANEEHFSRTDGYGAKVEHFTTRVITTEVPPFDVWRQDEPRAGSDV